MLWPNFSEKSIKKLFFHSSAVTFKLETLTGSKDETIQDGFLEKVRQV